MSKYKDFDKFFKETTKRNYKELKIFDKKYKINTDFPLGIVLEIQRKTADGTLSDTDSFNLMYKIIPSDIMKEWEANSIGILQFKEILEWLLNVTEEEELEVTEEGSGKK